MHSIEQPHDDLLVLPSDVWDTLCSEHRASVINLLTKLAYELVAAQHIEIEGDSKDEPSISNK